MKELSIENKAKAYDSIIEKAKKMHSENCEACQICIEELIPELAESEDEKIRKYLKHIIGEWSYDDLFAQGFRKEDIIAWLEKHGQKLAAWSEEDEEQLGRALYMMEQLDMTKSWDDVYNWLKSLKDRAQPKQEWSKKDEDLINYVCSILTDNFNENDKFDDNHPCIGVIVDRLKSLCPQLKQEWSEEDEEMMSSTVFYLNEFKEGYQEGAQKCISWLKSIKDGMQPKPEWSEEDKKMLDRLLKHFEWTGKYRFDKKDCDEARNWLKSLRPQSQWKPSDEQMHYLSWIANVKLGDSVVEQEVSKHLNELLEDLKKLKGE